MDINSEIVISSLKDEYTHDEARKTEAYYRLQMLRDDYRHLVEDRLNKYLTDDISKQRMPNYINTSQNVYKKIIGRLSRIYKKAPVRVFKNGEEILTKEQAADILALYEQMGIDRKMKSANRSLNAVNTVFVGPVYRDEVLCLDILTPDQVTVIPNPDDPSKMLAFLIEHSRTVGNKKQRYWAVWTKEQHYLLVEQAGYESATYGRVNILTPEAVDGNDEMVNPWGVIPYIDMHRYHLEAAYWDETSGSDLVEANIVASVRNSLLDFASVWQSFKQIAVEADDQPPHGMVSAPDAVLWGKGGAKWSVLDLQVNFKALREDLESLVSSVAKNYGVDLSSFNEPSQQSGVALKINNQDLTDQWDDQIEIFSDGEKRLWAIIQTINEKLGKPHFPGVTMEVIYGAMSITDETTEFDLDVKKVEKGVMSPAAFFMKYNDRVTDEKAAIAAMQENIKQNKTIAPAVNKLGAFSNLEDVPE